MRMGIPNKRRRNGKKKKDKSSPPANKPKRSSPNMVVGQVSMNVVASVFTPTLTDLATKSLERHAEDLVAFDDLLRARREREKRERIVVGDETRSAGDVAEDAEEEEWNLGGDDASASTGADEGGEVRRSEEGGGEEESSSEDLPPLPSLPSLKPVLFHSQKVVDEFESELTETARHFSIQTNGWKVHANAAKFERRLDEKYGVFRPFVTEHPEIERFVRTVQRRYAMGHFSPFRRGDPPLGRSASVVLLFMMHRNKIRWEGTVLTALFLLVGLQPWALVTIVSLCRVHLSNRKSRKVGTMARGEATKAVEPYYGKGPPDGGKTGEAGEEEESEEAETKRKMDCLLSPVGTSLRPDESIDGSSYDCVVLGSGHEALYPAALLSRSGRRVLVLSPDADASGCVVPTPSSSSSKKFTSIPFDVGSNDVSHVSRQQRLLAPALCTDTDVQGGIRFAKIGSDADGHAFEILSIPGVGGSDGGGKGEPIPFVLRADNGNGGGGGCLAEDAATYLGDGWPGSDGSAGNSATASYLAACKALNASSSSYYLNKILPESVNSLRNAESYQEASIRTVQAFLDKCVPFNPHVRALVAGIGMKDENVRPGKTSMGPHVSSLCAAAGGEGMHYPVGGPRALCRALASVVEQCGGRVVSGVNLKELVFEKEVEEEDGGKAKKRKEKAKKDEGEKGASSEPKPKAPRCVGVKLSDDREIRLLPSSSSASSSSSSSNGEKKGSPLPSPVVISTLGFVATFVHLLPESVRTKHGVPRGFPALTERRPALKLLVGLKGSPSELNLTGADYYRLPAAALPRDEMDPATGKVTFGEIGHPDVDNDGGSGDDGGNDEEAEDGAATKGEDMDSTATATTEDPSSDQGGGGASAGGRSKRSKHSSVPRLHKKSRKKKFETGKSWMRVSFPSAKDPTFPDRHGNDATTCVITVEADDDFVRFFDTKPKIYSIVKPGAGEAGRLVERALKDLVDAFPQLEGKIECAELCSPTRVGLSHNPERYAAKGIRCDTPYPGLFMGGSDLTVGDSFSGKTVSGWLVANAVAGYGFVDLLFLDKNITTDLEQFLDEPVTEDVAVPYDPPKPPPVAVPSDDGGTDGAAEEEEDAGAAETDDGADAEPKKEK